MKKKLINNRLDSNKIEVIKVNQDIIKRMANNSGAVKTIFVLITVAYLGVAETKISWLAVVCYAIITLILWYNDANYLKLERQFREHHKAIIEGKLNYKQEWALNPSKYKVKQTFFSWSTSIYWVVVPIVVMSSFSLFSQWPLLSNN